MSSLNARAGWKYFSSPRDFAAMDSDGFTVDVLSSPIAAGAMGFGQTSTTGLMKPVCRCH